MLFSLQHGTHFFTFAPILKLIARNDVSIALDLKSEKVFFFTHSIHSNASAIQNLY